MFLAFIYFERIMNKCTIITGQGSGNYSEKHLVSNDYYNENEQVQGRFYGKLQEDFNLNREITQQEKKEIFEQLYNNINPETGNKLRPRNSPNKGYDLTMSVPKGASLLYTLVGDERIKESFERSLEKTLKYIEDNQTFCRDNSEYKKEANIQTGNILADVYIHENSRNLDPQLHAHAFIFNATKDPVSGEFRAVKHFEITRRLKESSRYFENELAKEMQSLGYKTYTTYDEKGKVKSWEIEGISNRTLDKFSSRSKTVKEAAAEFLEVNGREPTHKELDTIKLETRANKLTKTSREEIKGNNIKRLSEQEKKDLSNVFENAKGQNKRINGSDHIQMGKEIEAVDYALEHLTERKSVITDTQLKTEIYENYAGYIDENKLIEVIRNNEKIVNLGDGRYTTKEIIKEEETAVKSVEEGKNKFAAANPDYTPFTSKQNILDETQNGFDYAEQRKAVTEILNSKDQIIVFCGVAGTGKTTALEELEKGYQQTGTKTFYFAPTTTATAGLSDEVLHSDGTDNEDIAHTAASLLMKAKAGKLDEYENSVLIIDEAGLLSTRQGAAIIEAAKVTNSRVVLVGDILQHKSVERGDFQRVIEQNTDVRTVTLENIRRQKGTSEAHGLEMRDIAKDFAKGDTLTGLDKLNRKGMIEEHGKDYIAKGVNEYMRLTENGTNLNDTLIVTTTNKEVDQINNNVRYRMEKAGNINSSTSIVKEAFRSNNWTKAELKNLDKYKSGQIIYFNSKSGENKKNSASKIIEVDKRNNCIILENGNKVWVKKSFEKFTVGREQQIKLAKGDQVRLTANDKIDNVKIMNGDICRVSSTDRDGNIIVQKFNDKNKMLYEVKIDKNNKAIDYGYVDTSQKAQGKGKRHVLNIAGKSGKAQAYVDFTRMKETFKTFTNKKDTFISSVHKSKDRELYHDIKKKWEKQGKETKKPKVKQKIELKSKSLDMLKRTPDKQKEIIKDFQQKQTKIKYYKQKIKHLDIKDKTQSNERPPKEKQINNNHQLQKYFKGKKQEKQLNKEITKEQIR